MYNTKIKNLNHFKKLTEIDISGQCGVGNAGILELKKLKFINATGNRKNIIFNGKLIT